jgi:hypothetical protein
MSGSKSGVPSKKPIGKDSEGKVYESVDELWSTQLGTDFVKKPKKPKAVGGVATAAAATPASVSVTQSSTTLPVTTTTTPTSTPPTTTQTIDVESTNTKDTSTVDTTSVTATSATTTSTTENDAEAKGDKKKRKKKKKKGKTASSSSAATASSESKDDEDGDEDTPSRGTWYSKGAEYWASIEATNNGVLGGFEIVSPIGNLSSLRRPCRVMSCVCITVICGNIDIKQSRMFLDGIKAKRGGIAVDCGAGIGRVTTELLLPYFGTVDLVVYDDITPTIDAVLFICHV